MGWLSWQTATTKPINPRALIPPVESSPHALQLEKALTQQQRPSTAKYIYIYIYIYINSSEEELKSLSMKVKEEGEKVDLKLNTQKTKIMVSGPITSWEGDGETVETVSDFILGGLQNHYRW